MDKIIEAVVQLIPVSKLFELMGIGKELNAALSLIVSAILIYIAVGWMNKLKSAAMPKLLEQKEQKRLI